MESSEGERSSLLKPQSLSHERVSTSRGARDKIFVCLAVAASLLFAVVFSNQPQASLASPKRVPLVGKSKSKKLSEIDWPDPFSRCDYVVRVTNAYARGGVGDDDDNVRARFAAQSTDANTFYRATARLFWRDFGSNSYQNQTTHWTESDFSTYWIQDLQVEGTNVSLKSLWTWTTGDQHLSNFGAWRNRHGDVVFGVNDFDEAAIYDFQMDVLRLAVSIANHAITNGFSKGQTKKLVNLFATAYVKAVIDYIGNEDASLFELTPATAKGKLQGFLENVDKDKSTEGLLEKFTQVVDGKRRFIKGDEIDRPHNKTGLAPTHKEAAENIRAAISPFRYGATRLRLGWNVHEWDDDFFRVLDVAARIGSGIGSFGVDRYYVLLKGKDNLLEEDADEGAVILDVKYQPPGAVHDVLSAEDKAWYAIMFPNDAARVVAAQSRLTSYTDPFLGWIYLPTQDGSSERAFTVRQRSPWKSSFDLSTLHQTSAFAKFIEQIAVATATAHVRGTVAKPPADFKHVVASVLGDKPIQKQWARFLTGLAMSYRKQVILDYECFRDHVTEQFFGNSTRKT